MMRANMNGTRRGEVLEFPLDSLTASCAGRILIVPAILVAVALSSDTMLTQSCYQTDAPTSSIK